MELQKAAGSLGYDVEKVRHVMFGLLNSADKLSWLESICWSGGSSLLEERTVVVVSISNAVLAPP